MTLNGLLLVVDVWILGGLVLYLHSLTPRFGFVPLLLVLGGVTALLQSQLGVYVEPTPGFIMFISSNVLVPVVLMSILVLYIANGAIAARMTIYGVLGISLLMLAMQVAYHLHLTLPGGGSLLGSSAEALLDLPNPRTTVASLVAFAADMFVIAIFYQGLRNHARWLPDWAVIGLALLAGLWTDAILFRFGSDLFSPDFAALLPGDVVGKTVSAFILWPVAAFYLTRIAPRLPEHVGVENRRTFDLFFGSLNDVKMALVRAEAALEKSEAERRQEAAYFQQISENVNEALWLASPNQAHAFYLNPAYERIWGRSASSLYTDPDSFINSIHPEDRARVVAGLPTQAQGNYMVEYRVVRPDGEIRWVRDRAFPIRNDQGEVYRIAGITEDITERKHIEKQQLELALERERVKLLRDFVSEFSHDLKNPLTTFNLKINQLNKAADPVKRRAYLDELSQQAARMNKMINDLLTLVRLEKWGEAPLVSADLNALVQTVCEAMRPLWEEKHLTVTLDLTAADPVVRADRDDLARALTNLVDNAVHYTPPGGRVKIETQVTPEALVIRVSDSGIGIHPNDQPHIFERFFRAANARATDPGGTGLGLAIVQKIVEQHQGRVGMESTPGQGTTFSIYLPN